MDRIKLIYNRTNLQNICAINKAKFENDFSTIGLRMPHELKRFIREHSSGTFDMILCGLIEHGLNIIEENNFSLQIDGDKNELIVSPIIKRNKGDSSFKIDFKVSRVNSNAYTMRINENIKRRLMKKVNSKFTIAILGLVRFALQSLLDNGESIIIINKEEKMNEC